MRCLLLFLVGAAINLALNAQRLSTDSLLRLLRLTTRDTNRVNLLIKLGDVYYFTNPDISFFYSDSAASLSRQLSFVKGEIKALNNAGESLRFLGDYSGSLRLQFRAIDLARKIDYLEGVATSTGFIGFTYTEFKEYRQALVYLFLSRDMTRSLKNQLKETFDLSNIGNAYDLLDMPDSALYYQQLSYSTYTGLKHGPLKSLILTRLGNAFFNLHKTDSALKYYHLSQANALAVKDKVNRSKTERQLATLHKSLLQYDSSLYYARQSFNNAKQSLQRLEVLETSELLVNLYLEKQNIDSAFFYQGVARALTDSLYGPQKFKELQMLMLEEQERQQEIQEAQERYRNETRLIGLLSALGVFLIVAFILYRNNRHKQKANKLLQETLSNLKAAQSNLIQSEKMASLGQLTAGIAHEIQNPLNFVNNFSELSNELIDEMKAELANDNMQQANEIADDIKQNLEKINHHGKRADAIVKGMLQQSRISSGQKEPTDINALCDEHLRLAYNGLRAKNKSLSAGQAGFNAALETDYDKTIRKIEIIPQDIGRVILNLITNAFYAVKEKSKTAPPDYKPTVCVSTKRNGDAVLISVKDNGNGIPQNIVDKIFQPFFTTKPTGQGTGLGLSLAYDIVMAHTGDLKVETKEGQGSAFIISLPMK